MIVHPIQDQQPIESPNGNFGTALATPSLGAQEVSVVRQRQTPGGFNPAHTQNREEVMVLLSGQVTVSGGEQPTELRAGDTLIVPANALHRIDNTGPVDAEWLIISVAGVQFFREDGAQARPGWLK
ncbi:cupin domain-containing protein [Deinococcus alpinitundrae]|uniref:cupin domain-containing protein n=1 Tax=Deinococcus alpinitundrae TaxID=468913 RepID=UPI00137A99C6|nr:cupin domain-containing protein [Deinococcus alpinitundrae]